MCYENKAEFVFLWFLKMDNAEQNSLLQCICTKKLASCIFSMYNESRLSIATKKCCGPLEINLNGFLVFLVLFKIYWIIFNTNCMHRQTKGFRM